MVVQLGRQPEALDLLRSAIARGLHPRLQDFVECMVASLERRHEDAIRLTYRAIDSGFADPEVFYHWAGVLAQAGDRDGALSLLERAIHGGFHPASALMRDSRFDPVRGMADFKQLARRADELQRHALETFHAADGPRLLGFRRCDRGVGACETIRPSYHLTCR